MTFATCPSPWSFLSMRLILISYLNHAYENILSEFEPSRFIILVPRAQNVKTSDFDLYLSLTSHVTSILNSLKCFGCVLWRAFEWRLARLSTTNGSRDSRGRDKPPPFRHSRVRQLPKRCRVNPSEKMNQVTLNGLTESFRLPCRAACLPSYFFS